MIKETFYYNPRWNTREGAIKLLYNKGWPEINTRGSDVMIHYKVLTATVDGKAYM